MTIFEGERPEPGSAPEVDSPSVRIADAFGVRDAGQALRYFATYLPAQAIPALLGFLVLPLLGRELAPTELGVLTISQTLITIGWIVVGGWLAAAVIRELPKHAMDSTMPRFSRDLVRAFGISGLMFLGFALFVALVGLVTAAVADNYWLILAATAGLVLQNVAVSLLAAGLRPRSYAVVNLLARVGGISLGAYLVFEGYKVQGYLFGLASVTLAVGSLGLVWAWPRGPGGAGGEAGDVRAWWNYGFPSASGELAGWVLLFVDRYLLAGLVSTAAVGVYTVGNVIGDKIVTIPALAFYTAAWPLLVRVYESHGRPQVEVLMRSYTRVVLLLSIPTVAFVTATAGPWVHGLTGNSYSYSGAIAVIPWVALGAVFYSLAIVGNSGLVVSKHTWPLVYGACIGLGVNVAINLVLIPRYGIMGAAVATPISNLTYLFATHWWARRYATWLFPYTTAIRAIAAALVGYVVARWAMTLFGHFSEQIAAAAIAGGIVYLATLLLLGERRAGRVAAAL